MIDAGILPRSTPLRSTGGTSATLRLVVDAWIDGQAVQWDAVAGRVASPVERRMAQQLRALARLSASAGVCRGDPVGGVRPHVLERALATLALLQVTAAVGTAVFLDVGVAASSVRVACLMGTVLAALGLLRAANRRPSRPLLGHALLLVAAWQARPFLDASLGAGAPLWLRVWWQAVFVEAFLPLAAWRVAHICPPAARFAPFERFSRTLLAAALACSIALFIASAVLALDPVPSTDMHGTVIPALGLARGIVSLVTVMVRSRAAPARVPAHVAGSTPSRWRAALGTRLGSILGTVSGTHATTLASLGADMQHARSPREVTSALMAHIEAALQPGALAMVTPGPGRWTVLAGALPPLAADSAIACLLASADEATRVDAKASVHALLPIAEREWLAAAGIETIVRLASRDGETLAGLLVGTRATGRPHSRRERAFIAAAARTAAVALSGLARADATAAGTATDDDLCFECAACGHMSAAGNTCACGGGRALAALPACLHGVFRVERRIGRGGMGIVYLGSDLRLDRPVALKTLPCLSSASVTTLRNEARAMAAVTHPSVAVLFGLEEWRGTPVLVTEYLPGGTLAARIAAGPLPLTDALALGATVADALAVLHGRGWLHRDIKPSNIGFCSEGTPKLLDFGLTRWRPATDDSSEPLAGTPLYLSPELLDGETPSAHDDIWALALVVVEMITGAHPFRADRLEDALSQVRSRTPVNVRHRVPTVPSSVDHVLSRALHPIPSRRFTSARELAAALRAVRIPS